ncbi:MAG: metallophosphoesterase, partial [Anaerolineae bacterium]|nr:metallophosphoesterase [Anaerolineae bacterium]
MSTQIAVLADIHLPDAPGSPQEAALVDALNRLRVEKPDVVLVLGDATAAGTLVSADRVRAILEGSGLCYRMIPGNSDRRSPDLGPAVIDRLTVDAPFVTDAVAVCVLDILDGKVCPQGRDCLKRFTDSSDARSIVLASHYPIETCMKDPSVRSLVERGRIALYIGAHIHRDQEYRIGNMSVHTVRGLDPDKAIGGPPAVALFELENDVWHSSEFPFEDGTVAHWSPSMRQDFIDHLGFSCMLTSLEGLHHAAVNGVRCVELKAQSALSDPRAKLLSAVRRWRDSGGRYLSMHMPDLTYDSESSAIVGVGAFQETVSLALALEADHVLLHVPRASVERMRPDGEVWAGLVSTSLALIREPMARGMVIGVENLHMNPGEPADDARGFGYLPMECREWVASLRASSGYGRIGIHLDIGHARNNFPFSQSYTLGQWYALVGKELVGYHLHQVILKDGLMVNHFPITDVYGPLISLSSFFWGWKTGAL